MTNRKKAEKAEESRAAKHNKRVKKTLKEIAADLVKNEWYIKIGLTVSGIQLAVAFTYLTGTWWAILLSAFAAVGKAAFVEGGVWLMNRTISHARAVKIHWVWQAALWLIMIALMWVSVNANLSYEWEKRAAVKYPGETIAINSENVGEYLTASERREAWQRGGLIPLLVLASVLVGRLMLASRDGFEKEEMTRFKNSQRQAGYRDKKKDLEKVLGGE
jgi:hypothetical protein